ncbi:MAG: exodeoxyribonuclease VII small subunit [Planctomycetota bacterium]|nr:exodeoxyribonuclease VII small subunit [Planctomycetota bacterium]
MAEKPKFEECLKQVEQVIQKLETGKLGLEESLAQYESGIAALRKCYEILGGVEKRVDLLMKDEKGNISATPFDTTATTEKEEQERSKRRRPARGAASPSDSEPAE